MIKRDKATASTAMSRVGGDVTVERPCVARLHLGDARVNTTATHMRDGATVPDLSAIAVKSGRLKG